MPMARAVRLCPDLLIVSSRHSDYGEVSKKVMAILDTLTPLVEQVSIDEAFLDITGTPQDAETAATGWLEQSYLLTEEVRGLFGDAMSLDALTQAAAATPPGCEGLLFLPYLQGERVPNLPRATGGVCIYPSATVKATT